MVDLLDVDWRDVVGEQHELVGEDVVLVFLFQGRGRDDPQLQQARHERAPVPAKDSHKLARWIQGYGAGSTKPLGRNELLPGGSAMAICQKDRQMQGH